MMGVLTQPCGKTSTRCTPDLTTFTRLDELGLEVVAQRVEPGQASLACRVVDPDDWCHRCGCQGSGAGHGHPAAGSCPVRVAAADAVAEPDRKSVV